MEQGEIINNITIVILGIVVIGFAISLTYLFLKKVWEYFNKSKFEEVEKEVEVYDAEVKFCTSTTEPIGFIEGEAYQSYGGEIKIHSGAELARESISTMRSYHEAGSLVEVSNKNGTMTFIRQEDIKRIMIVPVKEPRKVTIKIKEQG